MTLRGGALVALLLLLTACAGEERMAGADPPDTQVPGYEVVLEGAPDESFAGVATEALQLYRLQDEGAQSRAFLRRRAESDVPVLEKLLRSRGYYEGTVSVALSPEGAGEPRVTVTVIPGPPFRLAQHRLEVRAEGTLPPLDPATLGSPVDQPAEATAIVAAEDAAVGALRRAGFAYARFLTRSATMDPQAKTLVVVSRFDAGRAHVFGAVRFTGVTVVEPEYLASYQTWRAGETFDGAKLKAFQKKLSATNLFNAVSAEPPDTAPDTAALPIEVRVEERLPRTVAAGLRFDTAEGPEVYASVTHRNLFGRNEEGTAAIRAGVESQEFDLGLGVPQFGRDGQRLTAAVEVRREAGAAYDELGGTLALGVERQLAPGLTIGLGGLAEASRITDRGQESDAYLAGLPAFVARDTTNDPLDPSGGSRMRAELTPFVGSYAGEPTAFVKLDTTASVYLPIDDAADYVFATRARLATVLAEGIDRVPPTRRLYAGGGTSVRGYARDVIGPLDRAGDPVGGLSVVEIGAELRARIWKMLGLAVFVEAGSVSDSPVPDFDQGVQTAAGIGVRYYSPVGPVRFDIGVPLNPRSSDDPLQAYFSIGQAF